MEPVNPARPQRGSRRILTAAAVSYRKAMAGFLKTSLGYMIQFAGEETTFPGLDAAQEEPGRDPRRAVQLHGVLLVRKARLHVIAALVANRDGNLHSLAVQMRPALECAGQVVSVFHKLFIEPDPSAVDQYPSSDFLQTMQRALMDYFAHQMLVMVAHAALSPTAEPESNPLISNVFSSLHEKRAATRRHYHDIASLLRSPTHRD